MVDNALRNIYTIMLEEAKKDMLTNFYLRESLGGFLDKVIQEAQTNKRTFSIAIADVDHFKKFNDRYGHLFGDEVLKYMASTLRLTLQDEGYIFRYGGDEFVVVFPDKDPDVAYQLMRRCNFSVANRPFSYKGRLIVITISCGIASFPRDGKTHERLLKRADEALYFSKRFGRNATTMASKMLYLKLRRYLAGVGIMIIIGALIIAGRYIFKKEFNSTIKQVQRIKVIAQEPKDVSVITLKSGRQVRGYIVEEKDGKLTVSFDLIRGSGSLIIDKSEVAAIQFIKQDALQ